MRLLKPDPRDGGFLAQPGDPSGPIHLVIAMRRGKLNVERIALLRSMKHFIYRLMILAKIHSGVEARNLITIAVEQPRLSALSEIDA